MTCREHTGMSWYGDGGCFVCYPRPGVFSHDASRYHIEEGPGPGAWVQDMIDSGHWTPGDGRQGDGR